MNSENSKKDENEQNKQAVGKSIMAFREIYVSENRTLSANYLNCSLNALQNAENGSNYPSFDVLTKLGAYTQHFIWEIFEEGYKVSADIYDVRSLAECEEKERFVILLRVLCDKYNILSEYNHNYVMRLCEEQEHFDRQLTGYLIRIECARKNISEKKIAQVLGIKERRFKDMEKGFGSITPETLITISKRLDTPIDFFLCYFPKMRSKTIKYLESEIFKDLSRRERIYLQKYIEALIYKHSW